MSYLVGVIFGLAAMLFFGTSNFLVKGAMKRTDAVTFGTVRTFGTAILLLIYALTSRSLAFPSPKTWLLIIIFGVLGAIAYYTFSKAMKEGDVGIVVPIVNANTVITIILAAFLLGEVLDIQSYIYIALIIIGIIFISIKHTGKASKKSILLALTTFVIWGVIFLMYRLISEDIGPIMTGFYTESMIFLAFLPFFKYKKSLAINIHGWKIIISIIVLVASAIVAFNMGMYYSLVSIVSPIASAAGLVAVILGMIVYKERLRPLQYAGIVLITINIILLSLR